MQEDSPVLQLDLALCAVALYSRALSPHSSYGRACKSKVRFYSSSPSPSRDAIHCAVGQAGTAHIHANLLHFHFVPSLPSLGKHLPQVPLLRQVCASICAPPSAAVDAAMASDLPISFQSHVSSQDQTYGIFIHSIT